MQAERLGVTGIWRGFSHFLSKNDKKSAVILLYIIPNNCTFMIDKVYIVLFQSLHDTLCSVTQYMTPCVLSHST
jgi:hypothetical protein